MTSGGARPRESCASGGRQGAGVVQAALASGGEGSGERRDRRLGKAARHSVGIGPRWGKGCARVKIYGSSLVKCFYGLH
jgi:hypothetical protein